MYVHACMPCTYGEAPHVAVWIRLRRNRFLREEKKHEETQRSAIASLASVSSTVFFFFPSSFSLMTCFLLTVLFSFRMDGEVCFPLLLSLIPSSRPLDVLFSVPSRGTWPFGSSLSSFVFPVSSFYPAEKRLYEGYVTGVSLNTISNLQQICSFLLSLGWFEIWTSFFLLQLYGSLSLLTCFLILPLVTMLRVLSRVFFIDYVRLNWMLPSKKSESRLRREGEEDGEGESRRERVGEGGREEEEEEQGGG